MGDVSGEKGESLWFHEDGFIDHASGEKGSLLKLLSLNTGEAIPKTAELIAKKLNITIEKDEVYPEIPKKIIIAGELSEKHAEWLKARGIDPEIASGAGVGSASNGDMSLLHLDEEGRTVGVKFYKVESRQWHAIPGSANVLWPLRYVIDNFPDAETIYVTEGHWDALSAIQMGFPAVSVPNGANSLQWMETCFNFIHSFPNIVLCYDNDEAGATGLVNATNRLSRGVQIVDLPKGCKDINDVLIKHGPKELLKTLSETKPYTPQNVIQSISLLEKAREPEQFLFMHNTPFGRNFPFQYRDHESTIYTAYTGHGKSNLLRQTILGFAMEEDERCFVASFEDTPIQITRNLLQHMGPNMPEAEVERIMRNIALYDTTQITERKKRKKIHPDELIELFVYQYMRYGYSHFVVDNLMTLQVDRQDNTAQSDAAESFRQFVISYPVHLHLVAHPRKLPQAASKTLTPPDPSEIRGASEIADASFNIISLIRNIPKEREMDRMKFNGNGKDVIINYYRQHPDAILHVNKQRTTGVLPSSHLWFDPSTRTYKTTPNVL